MDLRRRLQPAPAADGDGIILRVALLGLIMMSLWVIGISVGFAADLPYGQVQAMTGGKIQINDRVFVLDPEVKVLDNSGKSRTLADIQPGVEIEFRLQKGRIDLIVWIVNGT